MDTIAVKGRIAGHRILSTRQRQVVDPDTGLMSTELLGAEAALPDGVTLRLSRYNGHTWARIEHSVPNLLYGSNIDAAPLAEVRQAVGRWHEQASLAVDWLDDVEHLRVVRIDLPRDFDGVPEVGDLLDNLARLHVPRSTMNERYADKQRGAAQSLRRGVRRAWIATAYDKTAEVRAHANRERDRMRRALLNSEAERIPDRLRFEPSLRARYLEPKGIRVMSDLTDQVLYDLSRHIFDRVRFGEPVGGSRHLKTVLLHLHETDPANFGLMGSVLATLYAEAIGFDDPSCNKTQKRNRRLAKHWGICAADVITDVAAPVLLDYDLGVLRTAA